MALAALNTGEASNRGRAVALLHPTTQMPIGIRFYLLGADSKEFKRVQREQEAARLEKQKKNRGRVYYFTPEETEANNLDLFVALTTGWDEDVTDAEGNVTGVRPDIELNDGEYVAFSPEAARRIYSDLGFTWLKEQVDSEIGDRKDFLPKANRS